MIEPKSGEKYRHFKGKLYETIAIARDAHNAESKFVVYKSLYDGEFPIGTIWFRSLEEFLGFKTLEDGDKMKRFVGIK